MRRQETFAVRVSSNERQMLQRLAQQHERSLSDVVRLLIRRADRDLNGDGATQVAVPWDEEQHAHHLVVPTTSGARR